MRKLITVLAAFSCAVMFSACAGIQVEKENASSKTAPKAYQHIYADNFGLYLFNIPLITGSTKDLGKTVIFDDTVNTASLVNIVTAKSKELGATATTDIVSRTSGSGFMFYFRSAAVSANAVK